MIDLCDSQAKPGIMNQKTDHGRNMYHNHSTQFNIAWDYSEIKTQGEPFSSLLRSDEEENI